MHFDNRVWKRLVVLVAGAILFNWLLGNFSVIGSFFGMLWGLCFPFIFGFIVAFVLNVPMHAIEKYVFRGRGGRLKRPASFLLSIIFVLALIAAVMFLVIPELVNTLWSLANNMPGYINNVRQTLAPYYEYLPVLEEWLAGLNIDWRAFIQSLAELLQSGASDFLGSTINMAFSIVNSVAGLFIGLFFASYLLLDKEHLTAQFKALLQAYLPRKRYRSISSLGSLVFHTYSRFVTGQCSEAIIVTCLYMLVLSVGQFQYWLLISVLIGFCSLVPMIGAFVGLAVAVILLLVSMGPWRALAFIIIFFIVQNIEGNIIYPRVVGNSVGLPPVWILVAVMVGGGLAGIFGMLLFIPLFSVFYTLINHHARDRLGKKGIESPVVALERSKPARKSFVSRFKRRKKTPENAGENPENPDNVDGDKPE